MNLPNMQEAKLRTDKKVEHIILENNIPNSIERKKYFLRTYGCQMNVHDTENIKAILEMMSFSETDEFEDADLILLNTCAIRENAHNKMFGFLGRVKHLKETKPHIVTAICGCMAQEENVVEALMKKYRWVDIVFGTHNLADFERFLIERKTKGKRICEITDDEKKAIRILRILKESLIVSKLLLWSSVSS